VVAKRQHLAVVHIAQGELEASVIKSHLESEGIPVVLQYESVGRVFGLTVDGLGEIRILVPQEFAERAKEIIKPREVGESGDESG
jgi:Putative prokaryotic signal transducing protein